MDPEAFHAELRRKKIRPAYLFSGDQDLLKEDAIGALRRAVGGESGRLRRFEGSQAKAAHVVDAQRNFSLLDPVAVIVVRHAAQVAKDEAEGLLASLEEDVRRGRSGGKDARPDGPPIVFWDGTLDRRARLFGFVAKQGGEVEFRGLNRPDARRWVEGEARRLGNRLSPGVSEMVVESIGTDLLKLRNALEVASLFVGSGRTIDEAAVLAVVPAARTHAMYELQDAVSGRDGAAAVRLLRRAVDEGNEIPVLVGALFAEVRRLLLAREVPPGTSPREAAERIGAMPFKVPRLLQDARRFSARALRSAAARLADIDVAVKTGRGDPVCALEEWIVTLCGPSRP